MKLGSATYLLRTPPQAYTVTVQVTDSCGRLVADERLCVPSAQNTSGDILHFESVADSWVDETRPDLNLGGSDVLRVNGTPLKMPYLRFEVSGLTGPVQAAWVGLEAIRASSGCAIHTVPDNTWDELAITYNNRPVVDGPALDTVGPVAAGEPVLLNVTPAISQEGLYSFAIASGGSDGWALSSRKASSDTPTLLVFL